MVVGSKLLVRYSHKGDGILSNARKGAVILLLFFQDDSVLLSNLISEHGEKSDV